MKIKKIRIYIFSFASILLLLLIWQSLSAVGAIDRDLVPPPTKVGKAIVEGFRSGELLTDLSASVWRGLTGLLIGSISGILLGLLTGRNRIANLLLTPILNIFKAFPPVAMLPIFITFFGIGNFSKVFSIFFATIFPLWVNTHLGARDIPSEFIRSARLLTTSRARIFFKVIIPACMNAVVAGFRISIAIGFIMVYVSELAGSSSGLGYRIVSSQLVYRMDKMIGALIILGIVASLVDYVFNRAINYFFPWMRLNKTL